MTKESGQALAAQEQGGALAPITDPTINLPILLNPEEALEVINENMEDLDTEYRFEKITVPGSGGIAFTIVDENGEPNPAKTISGIVLDKYSFKVWYKKSFDEKTDEDTGIPDCFSADCVHGSGCPAEGIPEGQLCKDCPKGQWGSARKGGPGKDCSDKIRIHVLREGRMFPFYMDIPSSSVKNFTKHVQRLADNGKYFYSVITVLGLEQTTNDAGTKYSRVTFNSAGILTKQEKAAIKQYIETLKPAMRKLTLDSMAEKPVETTVIENQDGDENPY